MHPWTELDFPMYCTVKHPIQLQNPSLYTTENKYKYVWEVIYILVVLVHRHFSKRTAGAVAQQLENVKSTT
jgi:hypothetical protein